MPGGRDPRLQLLEECSSPDTNNPRQTLELRDTAGEVLEAPAESNIPILQVN